MTFGPYIIIERKGDKNFVGKEIHTGRTANISAEHAVPCALEVEGDERKGLKEAGREL